MQKAEGEKRLSILGHAEGDMIDCPWCGKITRLIEIHSHLGCPVCKRPIYDCCDGDTAENSPSAYHYKADA